MKIGIISDTLNFKLTGIGNYTFQLIKGLNILLNREKPTLINYQLTDLNLPNPNLIIKNPFPVNHTYFWYPYLTFKLEQSDFDIIHNPSQVPTYFRFSHPSVMTVHDITTITVPESHAYITRLNDMFLLKKTLKNVNYIIADSENTKKDLLKNFPISPEKIHVVHLAADPIFRQIDLIESSQLDNQFSIDYKFILFTGTLEKRKNVLNLIKSFYLLKREGFPHKLVLAGKCGNIHNQLKQLIYNLNLMNDVIFTGFISNEELVYLYNTADVFVYPSCYEGFGLPPLEAMSCGCPVVCSNTSSLPEVVGDAGILVNPYSIEDIKNAMKTVITNTDIRNKMSRKGKERSQLFSWEKCARETYKVYQIAAGES